MPKWAGMLKEHKGVWVFRFKGKWCEQPLIGLSWLPSIVLGSSMRILHLDSFLPPSIEVWESAWGSFVYPFWLIRLDYKGMWTWKTTWRCLIRFGQEGNEGGKPKASFHTNPFLFVWVCTGISSNMYIRQKTCNRTEHK